MTKAEMLAYCPSKPGAWQDEPWDEDASYDAVVARLPKRQRPA